MDEYYFKVAYKEAEKAFKLGEVPVGAVIVKNNKIIAKSHNTRQKNNNLLGHAEINCILKAEKKIKDWRLDDCKLYVTLEPCELCKIFIKEARINKIYYNLPRSKPILYKKNLQQTYVCLECSEKYSNLLTSFFKNLRN